MLEIKIRMSLAPIPNHSNILYKKFWSFRNWSISSNIIILVGYPLPLPSAKDLFRMSICCTFFSRRSNCFFSNNLAKIPLYTCVVDHIDIQLRYATFTIREFSWKKSIIFVMREVFPQPVFPRRDRGAEAPF